MNAVFEQLAELLRADRLLADPAATGAGVRVGVIDSGVDATTLAQRHPNARAVSGGVFRGGSQRPAPYDGRASSPHGTTVADIILTLAPAVEIVSADVFAAADADTIAAALEWCVDQQECKVVNLSLGVPEARIPPARRWPLLRAVEAAYARDVLMVAAVSNDHPLTRSYPSMFAEAVIAVDRGPFAEPWRVEYRPHGGAEFRAAARGYVGPFAAEPATSWAAPHLAGVAAKLASLKPELKPFELKALLYWMSR